MRRTAAVVATLTLALTGYVTADAHDLVPGVVTLAPLPPGPAPFPTAPAAVEPAPVEPVLGPPDTAAPVPAADQVTALAEAAVAHPWMGEGAGVVVADQLTGEVLADVGGDVPREPASTAKLLTAAAAVTALDPRSTLATRVLQESPGRLVLVGGGDVMLSAGAGDPGRTSGRAGLADLADDTLRALRLAGVTDVALAVDESIFSGPAVSPAWTPSDVTNGFVAPVAALAVDIGKVRPGPYPPRHADPGLHAAQTFASLLSERGVTVTGEVTRTSGASGTELAAVRSAPVQDVVEYALHTSDNMVSEVLGRLVAVEHGLPGSFDGATRAVLAEVERLGVDVTGARLVDCSGLAEGSVLPPGLLTDLLLLTGEEPHLRTVAVDLPVGGWQGTLGDRFDDLPARGLVRAKTGSLTGTTSLAGTVVTSDGRTLVFAVVADRTPPGGQLGPRRVIDTFVQQLAGCGCALP